MFPPLVSTERSLILIIHLLPPSLLHKERLFLHLLHRAKKNPKQSCPCGGGGEEGGDAGESAENMKLRFLFERLDIIRHLLHKYFPNLGTR